MTDAYMQCIRWAGRRGHPAHSVVSRLGAKRQTDSADEYVNQLRLGSCILSPPYRLHLLHYIRLAHVEILAQSTALHVARDCEGDPTSTMECVTSDADNLALFAE